MATRLVGTYVENRFGMVTALELIRMGIGRKKMLTNMYDSL